MTEVTEESEPTGEIEVVGAQVLSVPENAPPEMIKLMHSAIEHGGMEALEKLVGLYERVEDRRAAMQFTEAMTAFQEKCPPIPHDAEAHFATRSGTGMGYSYASLNQVCKVVNPFLHPLGLSYSWDSTVDDAKVRVVCFLRHVAGHAITATFVGPVDSRNSALSGSQQYAATLTYGKRQSLIQALGVTTADEDIDDAPVEYITEHQVEDLRIIMEDVGADEAKFLTWLSLDKLANLPKARHAEAVRALERKRQ